MKKEKFEEIKNKIKLKEFLVDESIHSLKKFRDILCSENKNYCKDCIGYDDVNLNGCKIQDMIVSLRDIKYFIQDKDYFKEEKRNIKK